MIFTQFVDDALGCASYLVGDPSTGQAVVVDPAFAIEQYLEEAERREIRIVRVIETHTHADHLAGHGRLALEHGIPVSIHPAAEADYPHDPFEDGAEIALGDIVLRCIHTPGHRPEHCGVAVTDLTRGPWTPGSCSPATLALRRGRRTARPRGRGTRRSRGSLRFTAQARRAR